MDFRVIKEAFKELRILIVILFAIAVGGTHMYIYACGYMYDKKMQHSKSAPLPSEEYEIPDTYLNNCEISMAIYTNVDILYVDLGLYTIEFETKDTTLNYSNERELLNAVEDITADHATWY